jgi:hypothetical protein
MEWVAKFASAEDDGYCTIVSFADDAEQPKNYLILQILNLPTPEDVNLKQGGIHLEFGGQACSGYNVVRAISWNFNRVEISLFESWAKQKSLDDTIIIQLQMDNETSTQIGPVLEIMCKRLTSS